jgi:lipopolysaccharide heptosyltransferase II
MMTSSFWDSASLANVTRPFRVPPTVRRVAVFRALQLGDMLVAVPALRALRAQYPQAEITLIGLPWAASFARRFHLYIDRFVAFPGFPGIPEAEYEAERTARFLAEQQSDSYDLAIQLHGSGESSNPFVLALGSSYTIGFAHEQQSTAYRKFIPYPDQLPEIWRCLQLVRQLGCRSLSPRLEFPLTACDIAEAEALLRPLRQQRRLRVGLHAGARSPARRWPAARFAALADALIERYHAQIVLTGSPQEEPAVRDVMRHMQSEPLNLAGLTSLGGLGAVIERLDLFISNDTGPAHLACAMETPSITIFGPADPRRWAPLDRRYHRIVRYPVACSPCGYWTCPIGHGCLRGITPAAVLATANQLLARRETLCGA